MAKKRQMRVAFYLRVSTGEQTTDNQRHELEQVAQHSDWKIVEVYEEAPISGTKGRDKRPEFDRMLKDATRRKFDMVAAWHVDRMGRSVSTVSAAMKSLDDAGVRQFYIQQALDTETPYGKAMIHMAVVFAELEVAMIRERTMAGLERARKHGTKSGRPLGRPKISDAKRRKILAARKQGKGINKTAREVGVASGTVRRVIGESKE